MVLSKKIWLLWLQGWDKCGWLNKEVLNSWKINNLDFEIHLISLDNIKDYVNDIDYIFDPSKKISNPAKSDIIRLSLLKNHGGVWADATLLCMQPLFSWVHEAVEKSGLWMYHGYGNSCACWFIVAEKNGYMISKWKEACDNYWKGRTEAHHYNWMDLLFKNLIETDDKFKELWLKTPYVYCEDFGGSHSLCHIDNMTEHNQLLKDIFLNKPPYALKFYKEWDKFFPNTNDKKCINSNGYYAIQLSKRRYVYPIIA